jgi:hypothetical protein
VGYGISPHVQGFKCGLAIPVPRIESGDHRPERHSELAEVRPEVARVGVAVIDLAALNEKVVNHRPEHGRSGESPDDDGHGLGVKVTAETLELR